MSGFEPDFRAEADVTEFQRKNLELRRREEPQMHIGLEVERVVEEMGIGNKEPEFADGTRAFVVLLRESVAKDLYEHLDEEFGDE